MVARGHEQAGVADHLGVAARGRGHDRGSPRPSPRRRRARTPRRGRGRRRRRHRRAGPPGPAPRTNPSRARRRRVGGAGERRVEVGGPPAIGAGDHQAEVRVGRGERVERGDQRRQVLAGLDGAEGEHVALDPGEHAARAGSAAAGGVDPQGHGDHAVGIGVEQRDHLVAHEVRDRVHPGAAPQGPGRRGPGTGARRRVHSSGWCRNVRSWIVITCAAAGRRDDVVGPVHDVDGPGPALDAPEVGATPHRPQRAGGHRPALGGPDAGGEQRLRGRCPRKVTAKARTSTSSRAPTSGSTSCTNRPTPVRTSWSEVASNATRSGGVSGSCGRGRSRGAPRRPSPGPRAASRWHPAPSGRCPPAR